jgi:hypothetical protein
MGEPVRHHTLPQFVLRRFAAGEGDRMVLELVDRNDFGRVIPSNPRHALASNDFYTLETDEGRDVTMEKILAEHVEGPAAEAVRRLVEGGRSINAPGIRNPISLLIGFQKVRGHAERLAIVEHYKATAKATMGLMTPEMVREVARQEGEEVSDEDIAELVEFAKSGKYEIGIERAGNLHLKMFGGALQLARIIEARSWQLLEFNDPVLITSDEPVALMGRNVHTPGENIGVANADAIAFPLDPRHALVMVRPDLVADHVRFKGTPDEARIINLHVAFGAHRFIVRHPGTDPLSGIEVPKKAPPVWQYKDMIGVQPNASEAARARLMERLKRGEVRFRRPPNQDPEAA